MFLQSVADKGGTSAQIRDRSVLCQFTSLLAVKGVNGGEWREVKGVEDGGRLKGWRMEGGERGRG